MGGNWESVVKDGDTDFWSGIELVAKLRRVTRKAKLLNKEHFYVKKNKLVFGPDAVHTLSAGNQNQLY